MIDLDHLEGYRENNRIEAKKALGGLPHSIWETYSAFANALGGLILLGVEEYKDKSLHPVNLPDPEGMVNEIFELVSDPKKASVNILTPRDVVIENAAGNRIIVMNVPVASPSVRPVYVDNDLRNTFRRNGEGDYRCSPEEIQTMQRDAESRTPDMRIIPGMDLSVFCPDTVRSYRKRYAQAHPERKDDRENGAFFTELGAAAADEDGTLRPTAAGLLMFGRAETIRTVFPNYLTEYREETEGTAALSSDSKSWSGNLLDFYFRVCSKFQLDSRIPPAAREALNEALSNSLVNADHYGSGGITVLNLGSSVTFSNPGSFRIGLDRAKRGGNSDARNRYIQNLFHQIDVGERIGSGIPNIFRVWREQQWPEPQISQTFGPDRIMIRLSFDPTGGSAGGKKIPAVRAVKRQMVLDYLRDHISAKTSEIADYLEISRSAARTCLRRLISEGYVIARGNGRARVYMLRAEHQNYQKKLEVISEK